MKVTLEEIRERTYKRPDAWWTVLLVDPLASRLVQLVAPYRWITPNLLTVFATLLGFVSAACFAMQDRWWLVAGAAIFHLSFVVDCMDGKVARLNGTGSVFGAWLDYVFDRVRVVACGAGLMVGQFHRTGDVVYLYLFTAVVALDLFRYLNSLQMAKVRLEMRTKLADLRIAVPVAVSAEPGDEESEQNQSEPNQEVQPERKPGPRQRVGAWLRAHRIRPHLFSGIEFHMAIFILAPLTGWIVPITVLAGAGLFAFELYLIYKLYKVCVRFPAKLADAKAKFEAHEAELLPV